MKKSDEELQKMIDGLLDLEERLRHIPVAHGVDGADIALCHEVAAALRKVSDARRIYRNLLVSWGDEADYSVSLCNNNECRTCVGSKAVKLQIGQALDCFDEVFS